MASPNRWQQEFPNSTQSDAVAHVDGESYFDAVARAIGTARGKEHFIFITGWMMDVSPAPSVSKIYHEVLNSLKEAAKRRVKILIFVWNNPLYPNKMEELRTWEQKLSLSYDVTVHTGEVPYAHQGPQPLLRRFSHLMGTIKKNATRIIPKPDLVSTMLYNWTNAGNPSAQQISDFVKQAGFSLTAYHEKNVFVLGQNGLTGFCGGIDFNVNRMKPPKSPDHYYHDVAVEIKGPACAEILNKCIYRAEETIWGASHRKVLQDLQDRVARTANPPAPGGVNVQIVGTFNSPTRDTKIRSARDAYHRIVKGAQKYIYIEDQYMVNLDIAQAIGERVASDHFDFAMLVVQDSDETGDILVPNRKRLDFLNAVKRSIRDPRKLEKVHMVVINKDKNYLDRYGYHSGLHSKILIVDDEIAMIGSTNVNQRSFTLDSETSAVVYGGDFAKNLRMTLWVHMIQPETTLSAGNLAAFSDWRWFPQVVRDPRTSLKPPLDLLGKNYLRNYNLDGSYKINKNDPNQVDLDVRVAKWIRDNPNKAWLAGAKDVQDLIRDVWTIGGRPQVSFSAITDNPDKHVPALLDIIWHHMIDPKV